MKLESLEVSAESIDLALRHGTVATASSLVKHALATFQPRIPLKVVVKYTESDFRGTFRHRQFDLMREIRSVRDFALVLCVVRGGKHLMRMLKQAVAQELVGGGFALFSRKPSVVYRSRRDLRVTARL